MLLQSIALSSIPEAKSLCCYREIPAQAVVCHTASCTTCCKRTPSQKAASTAEKKTTAGAVKSTPLSTKSMQTPAQSSIQLKKKEEAIVRAQKQANHFVLSEWKNHADQHPYHVLASEEMIKLSKAYHNTYIKTRSNGTLVNTAPFTLPQVYTAYYSAVAAEGSLKALTT